MIVVAIEEQEILQAQHIDMIYSQLGTMYDIIPNPPQPYADLQQPKWDHTLMSVIGSISFETMSQIATHLGKMTVKSQAPTSAPGSQQTPSSSEHSIKVHMVNSKFPKNPQKNGRKNNKSNKNKNKIAPENTKDKLFKVGAEVSVVKILSFLVIFLGRIINSQLPSYG